MNTIYYLLADTKKGLVEGGRLINTDLETAKREAIRLAEELKTPIVIGSPVFDTMEAFFYFVLFPGKIISSLTAPHFPLRFLHMART